MQSKKGIGRTDSRVIEDINVEIVQSKNAIHSENALSMQLRARQRVPNVLLSSLRNKASQNRQKRAQNEESTMKQSKMGKMIKTMLKSSKKVCQVCQSEIVKPKNKNLEVYMCDCEHKFNFCESCLHHYVIYKVKTFEEVHCPHEGCPAMLDISSRFFQQLPIDVQKSYKKIVQFYTVAKNPDTKMCPKQDCQGIIRTTTQNVMVCDTCDRSCCAKCLLAVHSGECDSQQVMFFESNLHYRQCKKCKFVIEKNQGCNHMTCRCGNQFCYVCGESWAPAHYGNHDSNGQLLPVPAAQAPVNPEQVQPSCDCGCMDECCGQCCASILKVPLKFLLLLMFLLLMLLLFISKDLMAVIGVTLVSILAGMFGFSFELLSDMEGWLCLLAVLFFPITMIVGVGLAFRDIFCDAVPPFFSQSGQMLCDGCTSICQI